MSKAPRRISAGAHDNAFETGEAARNRMEQIGLKSAKQNKASEEHFARMVSSCISV